MMYAARQKRGSFMNDYCLQIGALAERRSTELALITAKDEAEEAALLANQAMLEAQAADRAKTKFLANMSHELRTPLNTIIGFSEVIQADKPPAKSDHNELATYIHDAGVNLLAIINSVLDLARIEARQLKLDEQLVPLDEVLTLAITAIAPAAEKKSIGIFLSSQTPTLIRLDLPKMTRALSNLLSNAVKFTETGGRVEVTSGTASDDGDLLISISDTGIGIPTEHLTRVFEPFGQIEDYLTRQSEGFGLGLPMARALVGLHNGEMSIDSRLGVGTTVKIRLPAHRIEAPLPAPSPFPHTISCDGRTILERDANGQH
jgi:two-component system cell cycle sensor histidine kinase PleC